MKSLGFPFKGRRKEISDRNDAKLGVLYLASKRGDQQGKKKKQQVKKKSGKTKPLRNWKRGIKFRTHRKKAASAGEAGLIIALLQRGMTQVRGVGAMDR